ncbi:PfkB family carbohydrate kinase [Necropsobacter rosorum]|uniref:ribokinase n=1 Tax=Necropsobacter rosorum TaxID=908285 RepID=UPI003C7DF351
MQNLTQNERQLFILKLLANEDIFLSAQRLAEKFNVSPKTIRQDIRKLSSLGLVSRVHGGIRKREGVNLSFQDIQSAFAERLDETLFSLHLETMNQNILTKNKILIFGAFNIDILIKLTEFPKPRDTILSKETDYMMGGKGFNQAQAICANNTAVTYVTKIGRDHFYRYVKNYLSSRKNMKSIIFESEEFSTGMAVVLVREDGEKEIIVNPGANQKIKKEDIFSISDEILQAEFISLQMENNLDATITLMSLAHQLQRKIVLDPTPFVPEILDFLSMVYLLIPNISQAEKITGITIKDDTDAISAVQMIHKMGVENIVLTLGEKGAIASTKERYQRFSSYKAIVVDKSGIGDGFNGALLSRLVAGDDLFTATDYACAYASLCIERFGASSMPNGELVKIRMK